MSYLSSIGMQEIEPVSFLREKLDVTLDPTETNGIEVVFRETAGGSYTFLDCHTRDRGKKSPEKFNELVRHYAGAVLTEAISSIWEPRMFDQIIKKNFSYFDREEREIISLKARQYLDEHEQALIGKGGRKDEIYNSLLEYLQGCDFLIVEGFVNFRLRSYWKVLEKAVEQAVDEYLLEKEQHEFIGLLKCFVEAQEPRIKKIHVILKAHGDFQLYDSKEFVSQDFQGFTTEIINKDISYEDFLVSLLITIAPREIVLHVTPESPQELVDTLKDIFDKRIKLCSGCNKCLSSNSNKH